MMANNEKFTVEYIASLPIRKINQRGQLVEVRYDDKKKIIFQLDEHGSFTGKWGYADLDALNGTAAPAMPTDPPIAQEATPQEGADTDLTSSMEPLDLSSDADSADATKAPETQAAAFHGCADDRKKPKKLAPYQKGIAFVAALALLAFLLNVFSTPKKPDDPENLTTAATTEHPTANTAAETQVTTVTTIPESTQEETVPPETEPGITVIAAVRDMIPGHKITRNDLAFCEISRQDYLMLQAISGLYTESDADDLIGLEASSFISGGAYIDHDDLAVTYAPASPWNRSEQQPYIITLPVTITPNTLYNYLPGTQADITIATETTVTGIPETTQATTAGAEHSSTTVESTIISTYVIRGATCLDILDKKQNSLYPAYAALASVPTPYLSRILKETYPTVYHMEQLIPAYITIAVTSEQADILQPLNNTNMEVAIGSPSGAAETKTQADTYQQLLNVAANLANQWTEKTGGGN